MTKSLHRGYKGQGKEHLTTWDFRKLSEMVCGCDCHCIFCQNFRSFQHNLSSVLLCIFPQKSLVQFSVDINYSFLMLPTTAERAN